jgi:predicted transcriptional regulator
MAGGTTRVSIVYSRLTLRERTWLDRMAQQERRSVSSMIRQAIVEAARRRGLWPVEGDGEGKEEAA